MFARLLALMLVIPFSLSAQRSCSLDIALAHYLPSLSTSRKFPIIAPDQESAVANLQKEFNHSLERTRKMSRAHGELSSEHIAAAEQNLGHAEVLLQRYGEKTTRVPMYHLTTGSGSYLAHGLKIEPNPNLPLGELAHQLGDGRLIHMPLFLHRMDASYAHGTQTLIPSAAAITLGRATPDETHELGHRALDTMNDEGRPSLFHGVVRSTDGKAMDLPAINRLRFGPHDKIAYLTKTGLSELYTFGEQYRDIGVEYVHAVGAGTLFGLPPQKPMADAPWFLSQIHENATPHLVSSIIADAAELFRSNLTGPQQWQRAIRKLAFGRLANPNASGLKVTLTMQVKNVEIEMDFVGPGISELYTRFQPFAAQATSPGHQAIVREIIDAYFERLKLLERLGRETHEQYYKLVATTAPQSDDAIGLMLLHLGLAKPSGLVAPYVNYATPIERVSAP